MNSIDKTQVAFWIKVIGTILIYVAGIITGNQVV